MDHRSVAHLYPALEVHPADHQSNKVNAAELRVHQRESSHLHRHLPAHNQALLYNRPDKRRQSNGPSPSALYLLQPGPDHQQM